MSINNITRYTPGFNINDVQRKYKIKKIVKLSSNENPFISDKVSKYISKSNHNLNLYPESKTSHLQALIAKMTGYKLNENNILLGNGSNEILEFIVRATLNTKSEVIIPKHSFLVYEIISQLQGAKIITSNPNRDKTSSNYLGIDIESIRKKITKKTRLIFLANPGNPTGTYLKLSEIDQFMGTISKNISVVVDEAYYEYLDSKVNQSAASLINKYKNLYVTRSFSKIYGLASLRIGYGISSKENIDKLKLFKQPFNTNLFAQKAAELAIQDYKFVEKSKRNNDAMIKSLTNLLDQLSVRYLGTYCNFITFEVGEKVDLLFDYLLKKGIVVRPLKNYKLSRYLRVSLGTQNDMKKFSKILKIFYEEKTK